MPFWKIGAARLLYAARNYVVVFSIFVALYPSSSMAQSAPSREDYSNADASEVLVEAERNPILVHVGDNYPHTKFEILVSILDENDVDYALFLGGPPQAIDLYIDGGKRNKVPVPSRGLDAVLTVIFEHSGIEP